MDIHSLIRLKDALEGAQRNTSKMLTRLERFENRLTDLDEKMRPIQSTTTHYTKAKENIALTLLEVGKTYEHFRAAGDVKDLILKSNYSSDIKEEYFQALSRIAAAKRFFDEHPEIKAAAAQGKELTALFNHAVSACLKEFERLLRSGGKSVECVQGQWNILNPLSASSSAEIQAICRVFESNALNQHFEVYKTVRVNRLRAELHASEVAHSQQWEQMQQEGPYERRSHPFHDFFSLTFWLLRSELQLWGSTLPSELESLAVFAAVCEAGIAELQRVLGPIFTTPTDLKHTTGSAGSSAAAAAVKRSKLLLLRLDILDTFISRYDEFRDLCQPDVRRETPASRSLVQMRAALVQACIEACEFLLSATSLLEAYIVQNKKFLGGLSTVSALTSHTPGSHGLGSGSINGKLGNFSGHGAAAAVAAVAAAAALGNGSSHNGDAMSDAWACDLHPVTGNVLYCCQEILEYHAVYSRMCNLAIELRVTIAEAVPTSADDYVCAVLENLYSALEDRAVLFEDNSRAKGARRSLAQKGHALYDQDDKMAEEIILYARKHLFLANNLYTVIIKVRDIISDKPGGNSSNSSSNSSNALKRRSATAVAQRVQNLTPYLEKATTRLEQEQHEFCNTICAALGITTEEIADFKKKFESDKAGQSKLLKAKFQMFNTGMDALLQQQGEWRVSSAGLRERIGELLMQRVLSTYRPFFDTYSTQKFSKKHMDEYLKYRPQVVENHLHMFFGRS